MRFVLRQANIKRQTRFHVAREDRKRFFRPHRERTIKANGPFKE